MSLPQSDQLKDPALFAEVELARAAAQHEAGDEEVGAHVDTQIEGDAAVTHLFEAAKPGYQGWRWAATVSSAGPGTEVTVSEVVLLPGPDALVAPDWIPWENRVQAGDLGVGDLLPTAPDDPRLVPAYVWSDDPAVEEAVMEVGLGRARVMARPAREEAAERWQESAFGPRSDMAKGAPAHCGTCGFYLPLAGSLSAAFGTCGNEISPADAHVVHAEYGCGAHSEAEVEQVSPVLVANLIYDDALLDVEPLAPPVADPVDSEPAEPEPEATTANAPEQPDADPDEPEATTADTPEPPDTEPDAATDPEPEAEPVAHAEPAPETAETSEPSLPEATTANAPEPPDTEPDAEPEAHAAPSATEPAADSTPEAGETPEISDTSETSEPSLPEAEAPAQPEPASSTETGPTETGSTETGPTEYTLPGFAAVPIYGGLPDAEPVAPLEPIVATETSVPDPDEPEDGADPRPAEG